MRRCSFMRTSIAFSTFPPRLGRPTVIRQGIRVAHDGCHTAQGALARDWSGREVPGMPVRVELPDLEHWKAQVKCQTACPVQTDAGRYVQLIAEGRNEDAYLVA